MGDLVAIKGTNQFEHRSFLREQNQPDELKQDEHFKARVFAELVLFIEYSIENEIYIFKFSEIHNLTARQLHDFGVDQSVHKTRLKQKILNQFPGNVQEQTDGKNGVIIFNEGMKNIIKQALELRDYDNEAMMMIKLVKVIANELSSHEITKFNGIIKIHCFNAA